MLNFLTRNRLDRKLVDIALAETHTPPTLKEEATQEILLSWYKETALPKFNFSETASYAHKIAKTAALRIRRELGAAVRIPGSAFQPDGRVHLSPGLLAAPLELSEAEHIAAGPAFSILADIEPLQLLDLSDHLTCEEDAVLGELMKGNSIYRTTLNLKLSRALVEEHLAAIVQTAVRLGLCSTSQQTELDMVVRRQQPLAQQ